MSCFRRGSLWLTRTAAVVCGQKTTAAPDLTLDLATASATPLVMSTISNWVVVSMLISDRLAILFAFFLPYFLLQRAQASGNDHRDNGDYSGIYKKRKNSFPFWNKFIN